MAYTGRLHLKGVPFSGFRYILLVEVYERVGKYVIWVCERALRANRWFLWLYEVEKTLYFCDWVLFKRLHLQQLKGLQSSKRSMWKGYHLSIEGIRKGYLFRQKWYVKGKGLDLGAEYPPPPPGEKPWVPSHCTCTYLVLVVRKRTHTTVRKE